MQKIRKRKPFPGRPSSVSGKPSDCKLVENALSWGKLTNSVIRFTDIVQRVKENLDKDGIVVNPESVKVRVARGLRALQKTGQVEKVGKLYRLADDGEKALAYLDLLRDSVDTMKEALKNLNDESRRGLVGAAWEFLRDRFKDTALKVELELRRARIPLERPLSVRPIEPADEPPAIGPANEEGRDEEISEEEKKEAAALRRRANRRFLVQFEARSIEGWDLMDKRNALTALQRGFFSPSPSPRAAPGGRPSPRSGARRTPSRPRAGRGPRGRRRPSRPSSRRR